MNIHFRTWHQQRRNSHLISNQHCTQSFTCFIWDGSDDCLFPAWCCTCYYWRNSGWSFRDNISKLHNNLLLCQSIFLNMKIKEQKGLLIQGSTLFSFYLPFLLLFISFWFIVMLEIMLLFHRKIVSPNYSNLYL